MIAYLQVDQPGGVPLPPESFNQRFHPALTPRMIGQLASTFRHITFSGPQVQLTGGVAAVAVIRWWDTASDERFRALWLNPAGKPLFTLVKEFYMEDHTASIPGMVSGALAGKVVVIHQLPPPNCKDPPGTQFDHVMCLPALPHVDVPRVYIWRRKVKASPPSQPSNHVGVRMTKSAARIRSMLKAAGHGLKATVEERSRRALKSAVKVKRPPSDGLGVLASAAASIDRVENTSGADVAGGTKPTIYMSVPTKARHLAHDAIAAGQRLYNLNHHISGSVLSLAASHDEIHTPNGESVAHHLATCVMWGVLEGGLCVACVLASFNPALAWVPPLVAACEHTLERSREAHLLRRGEVDLIESTAGLEKLVAGNVAASFLEVAKEGFSSEELGMVAQAMDVFAAFVQLARHGDSVSMYQTGRSLLKTLIMVEGDVTPLIEQLVASVNTGREVIEPTTFGLSDIRTALLEGNYGENLPTWIGNLLVLAGQLTGLSIAGASGLKFLPSWLLTYCEKAKVSGGMILTNIIEAVEDLIHRAWKAIELRSLSALFDPIIRDQCLLDAQALLATDPMNVEVDTSKSSNVAMLRLRLIQNHVEECYSLLTKTTHPQARQTIMTTLKALFSYQRRARSAYFGQNGRPAPANMALVGNPGVGKSLLTFVLHQTVAAVLEVEFNSDRIFEMNGDFAFMDGYGSSQHLGITVDEWASMSKDKIDAKSVSNLIKLTGEAPFQAPMADINKMGTQFVSQLSTVLTTNAPDLGFVGVMTNPGAMARRFTRIEVKVKPEYLVPDTCRIRSELLVNTPMDAEYWDGEVYVDAVKQADVMAWRCVGKWSSLNQLIGLITPIIRKKFMVGDQMAQNRSKFEEALQKCASEWATKASESQPAYQGGLIKVHAQAPVPETRSTPWSKFDVVETVTVTSGQEREWIQPTSGVDPTPVNNFTGPSTNTAIGVTIVTLPFLFYFAPFVMMALSVLVGAVLRDVSSVIDRKPTDPLPKSLAFLDMSLFWAYWATAWADVRVSDSIHWLRASLHMWVGDHAVAPIGMAEKRAKLAKVAMGAAGACLAAWYFTKEKAHDPGVRKCVYPCKHCGEHPAASEEDLKVTNTMGKDEVQKLISNNPTDWQVRLQAALQAQRSVASEVTLSDRLAGRIMLGAAKPGVVPTTRDEQSARSMRRKVLDAVHRLRITVPGEETPRVQCGLAIGGGQFLTNEHGLANKCAVQIVAIRDQDQGVAQRTHVIDGEAHKRIDETDAAIIALSTRAFPKISHFFLHDAPVGSFPVGTKVKIHTLDREFNSVITVDTFVKVPVRWSRRESTEGPASGLVFEVDWLPANGQSGGVAEIMTENGSALAGITVGRHTSRGTGVIEVVTRKMLDSVHEEVEKIVPTFGTQADPAIVTGKDPHARSWAAQRKSYPEALPLGDTKRRSTYRFRWKRNALTRDDGPLKEYVRKYVEGQYAVPATKGFVTYDDLWADPQAHKLPPGDNGSFGWEAWRAATDEFLSAFPDDLRLSWVGPLTPEEAIFGSKEKGVPAMDLNKSSGLGGMKHQWVDVETKTLKPEFRELIDRRLKLLEECDIWELPIVLSSLKNELRPISKIVEGETRHFNPYPFDALTVQRMYLYPILLVFLALGPEITGQAIGINAADPRQWGGLIRHLLSVTEDMLLFEGDFKNYDASTQQECYNFGVAVVVAEVARRMGWSKRDIRMLVKVVQAYPHCLLLIDGFAMLMWMSTLSGVISTDLVNGIIVWLLLCIVWHWVVKQPFRGNVALVCLGDDHLGGVRDSMRKSFSPDRIVEIFSLVGMIYTNADKTKDFAGFYKKPSEAKFLQRSCVLGADGLWRAPIVLKRALRCLWLFSPSTSVREAEQYASMVHNCARECFMHGAEEYETFKNAVPETLECDDGSHFVCPKLPTYDELYAEWACGKMVTWDSGGQWAYETRTKESIEVDLVETTSGHESAIVTPEENAKQGTTEIQTANRTEDVMSGNVTVPRPIVGSFEDILSRPVTVFTTTITSTSTNTGAGSGTMFGEAMLNLWIQTSAVKAALKYKAWFQGRFCVSVSLAATQQHRGLVQLLLSRFIGYRWAGGAISAPVTMQQLAQAGSTIVQLSGPQTIVLKMVTTGLYGPINMTTNTAGPSTTSGGPVLWMGLMAPLTHASLATAPSVPVVIRAWVEPGYVSAVPYDTFAYTSGVDIIETTSGREILERLDRWSYELFFRALHALEHLFFMWLASVFMMLVAWGSARAFGVRNAGWFVRDVFVGLSLAAGSLGGTLLTIGRVYAYVAMGAGLGALVTMICTGIDLWLLRMMLRFRRYYGIDHVEATSGQEYTTAGMVARNHKLMQYSSFGSSVVAAAKVAASVAKQGLDAVSSVGAVAALAGLGRPQYSGVAQVMAQAPNADIGLGVSTQPGVFALDLDPSRVGAPVVGKDGWPEEDEMSLAFLMKRPSLVYGSDITAEYPSTASVGDGIGYIPVCPATVDAGKAGGGATTLQACMVIGQHCMYWRGRCKVKVMVVTCSMDAGRLVINWAPGAQQTGSLGTTQFPSCLIDVGLGQTECEMEVPWSTPEKMLPLPTSFALLPMSTYGATYPDLSYQNYCNGMLNIFVDSPIVSSQTTPSVGIKVFFTWEDLEFFSPSMAFRETIICTSGMDLGVADDGEAMGVVSIVHLRQLLSRPTYHFGTTFTVALGGDVCGGTVRPRFGYHTNVATNPAGLSAFVPTPLSNSLVCYEVVRGSTGVRVVPTERAPAGSGSSVAEGITQQMMGRSGQEGRAAFYENNFRVPTLGQFNSGVSSLPRVARSFGFDFMGGFFLGQGQVCGAVLPWVATRLFRTTQPNAIDGIETKDTTSALGTCFVYLMKGWMVAPATTMLNTLDWYYYCGEDILMCGFSGAPVVASQSW